MKVLAVSPLPPSRTGVADYTAGLLPYLRRHAEVRAVEEPADAELRACDAALYHLGDNSLHAAAYQAALRRPGVAVLHEAVLNHLLLGTLDHESYVEEFVYNYGEWFREKAGRLWDRRALSMGDPRYFRYPVLRRLLEASRAVVVHNSGARKRVLEAARTPPPVTVIPHYVTPPRPFSAEERRAVREALGAPQDAVLIGSFGFLRPAKRIRSLLQAARLVPAPWRLLLAGDPVLKDYAAAWQDLLDDPRIIRRPFAHSEEFERLLAAADIGVSLRDPSAGETSGVTVRLMAHGKPVLVTAGEDADFPPLSVIPVDPGEGEVEMLAHYLYLLACDESVRERIGRTAAAHIAACHHPERAAAQYMEAARSAAG